MLSSNTLRLRKMQKDDVHLYHCWRNDLEAMATTSLSLDNYTKEETDTFVENVILHSHSSKSYIMEVKENSVPIGVTSLINIDTKNRNAECIIDIGDKKYWGKGYGTEALKLLIDYAFLELNLHRVSLRVFSFNEKAIHIYSKLGFEREALSEKAYIGTESGMISSSWGY